MATVRAGNIIGGGDWAAERLIPDIVRAFSAGATLAIRNPTATRPWQHVLEPIRGCLILAEVLFDDPARFAGGWNFGAARDDQRPVSWIVEYCARQWGEGARWKVDSGVHSYEAQRLGLTSSKAELQLGWRPVWRLETALDHTLHWYRAMIDGRDMLKHTQRPNSQSHARRTRRIAVKVGPIKRDDETSLQWQCAEAVMKQPGDAQASKSIQVICPVYNEELNVNYFYDRYRAVRDRMTGNYRLELSFIDNASTDRTSEAHQGASCAGSQRSADHAFAQFRLSGVSALWSHQS